VKPSEKVKQGKSKIIYLFQMEHYRFESAKPHRIYIISFPVLPEVKAIGLNIFQYKITPPKRPSKNTLLLATTAFSYI
jgi:hypothetical protein